MENLRIHAALAGAVALAFASGTPFAAGPVGTIPFNGDGSGTGFTVDNALFDPNDVTAAPCPDGATCTNMTATEPGSGLLMREVDTGTFRFIQTIVSDTGGPQGDFVYESSVSTGGDANAIGTKVIIDDAANEFFSTQAAYRGAIFGAGAGNNNLSVEVHQDLSSGFQTFDMETTASPNQGASLFRNGRLQILQPGDGAMQDFTHVIVAGTFQTSSGTLTAGSESFTFAAGNTLSATWIGGAMAGGGPGVVLAPGQTQNHDTRTAEQRDFGLLIYRGATALGNTIGAGNAGGTPNGIVDPQFSQTGVFAEARGFALPEEQDTGLMYNLNHGSFFNGSDILTDHWDDAVFGPNPF